MADAGGVWVKQRMQNGAVRSQFMPKDAIAVMEEVATPGPVSSRMYGAAEFLSELRESDLSVREFLQQRELPAYVTGGAIGQARQAKETAQRQAGMRKLHLGVERRTRLPVPGRLSATMAKLQKEHRFATPERQATLERRMERLRTAADRAGYRFAVGSAVLKK